MKFLNILTVSVATTCLISCQSEPIKTYYLTPFVTGVVLDKETDKPIEGVNVVYTSNTYTMTNSQGEFELPAIAVQSNKIDVWQSKLLSESSFHFSKQGYITKSYWNFGLPRINQRQSDVIPEYIHMGNIYLTKKSTNDGDGNEGEYIEEMTFCQPHESQKEVNCIPKPVTTE